MTGEREAAAIFSEALPVLRITGLDGPRWKRNIANNPNDARIGPWLRAAYMVLNDKAWREKCACLYLVQSSDGVIRYVGISRNGVKHRWRTSPAYDAQTMQRLSTDQLFHSQCWKHMERMNAESRAMTYEVRTIAQHSLSKVLSRLGPPLSAFLALGNDGEGMCAGVERWLCNHSGGGFLSWNTAMKKALQ